MVEIPSAGKTVPGKIIKSLSAADFATKKATTEQGSYDVRAVQVRVTLDGEVRDLARGLTARIHLDGKGAGSK